MGIERFQKENLSSDEIHELSSNTIQIFHQLFMTFMSKYLSKNIKKDISKICRVTKFQGFSGVFLDFSGAIFGKFHSKSSMLC